MLTCPKCSQRAERGKLCRACGAILEHVPDDEPSTDRPAVPAPAAAKRHSPLGLPSGSIRALLTFLIVAVVIAQIVRGQQVELLWTETLMIALAHYFTSRRLISLSPEVIARLTAEGQIQPEGRPLYLPRHSVRAILVLAFVGLAVYLYQHDRLMESQALSVLGVVAAYFLGIVARVRNVPGWEDVKALIVLSVLVIAAVPYFVDRPDLVSPMMRNITLGLVLFYFGSR
ncbi:MAG: hypothetical protein WCB27_21900 [Thermoguttaceae bacterium]